MGSHRIVVGAVLLVCCVQYFLAELVAASAWVDPPYSWTRDYISELGAVHCDPDTCSPDHAVIQVSLVLHACLILAAAALLLDLFASRIVRTALALLALAHAAGNLVVASAPLSPESGTNTVHYLGAAVGISSGIALVGLAGLYGIAPPARRTAFRAFSMLCATVSLAGLVLVRWNATHDSGMPPGVLERMAVDPIVVWCVVSGVCLGVRSVRHRADRSELVR